MAPDKSLLRRLCHGGISPVFYKSTEIQMNTHLGCGNPPLTCRLTCHGPILCLFLMLNFLFSSLTFEMSASNKAALANPSLFTRHHGARLTFLPSSKLKVKIFHFFLLSRQVECRDVYLPSYNKTLRLHVTRTHSALHMRVSKRPLLPSHVIVNS